MLDIITLLVTPFQQNCRILAAREQRTALVVDPGGDVRLILDKLKGEGLSCSEIWLTHAHLDHCGGVAELKAATGATLLGHEIERDMRAMVQQQSVMFGLPPGAMDNCPEPDRYIADGDTCQFGGVDFEVLFTPGHSPGHVCFYAASMGTLLAGDTVFSGSIGRTDLPGGDHASLLASIKEKIMTLPDDTLILSGHGPDTTVGVERGSNPFLQG